MKPGINIFSSKALLTYEREQFRFPRSKRRRIRRKWAKRPRNFRSVHVPKVIQVGGRLYCDPISFHNLQTELRGAP